LFNKNNASQDAFELSTRLAASNVPYFDYLKGVTFFQLMDFDAAEKCLLVYVAKSKSSNYKKDCFYKLSIIYELVGDSTRSIHYREKVKKLGSDVYYVDKQASKKVYSHTKLPLDFVRAKIAFDGGLFETSIHCLLRLPPDMALGLDRDYLLARNFELLGAPLQSIAYYKRVLAKCPKDGNYKGPMACLHLSEMALEEGKEQLVAGYLHQLEQYSNYEHKSAIQNKALKLKKLLK